MRIHPLLLSLVGLAFVGACSRGADSHQDDALKNDLALAAQAQSYTPSQFTSPSEQQLGAATAPQYAATPRAPQQVYRAPAPVRRAPARRTASRTRSSGGGSYGTYPSVPSDPPEPQRNTKRDAVIGAAAGAVIGATTSRDRVKGGIIGAAAGGILGGIIGHTIDVKRY